MKLTEYKNVKKPIEYFTTISNENYLVFFPFIDYYILLEKNLGIVKYYMKYYMKYHLSTGELVPIVNEKKDLSIFEKMNLNDDYENTENINICEMMDLESINFAYMFSAFLNRENVLQKFEKKYLPEITEFNKEFQDGQYLEMKEKMNDKSFNFENISDKDILEFIGETDMYDCRENNLIPSGDHPFQCVEPNGNVIGWNTDLSQRLYEPLTEEEISMDLQLEKEAESENIMSYTIISKEILHGKNINVMRKNIMKKYSTVNGIMDLLVLVEDECTLNIMAEKGMIEWDARRHLMDNPEIRYSLFHERAKEYLTIDN